MECNNDINTMIDLAKVADLVSVANLKSWNKQMFLMTIFIYLTSYLMPEVSNNYGTYYWLFNGTR